MFNRHRAVFPAMDSRGSGLGSTAGDPAGSMALSTRDQMATSPGPPRQRINAAMSSTSRESSRALGYRTSTNSLASSSVPQARSTSAISASGFLLHDAEGVVGGPQLSSHGAVRDESGGALRKGRGEHRGDGEASGLEPQQGGASRVGCVHDRTDILHPALEGELLLSIEDVVGQPRASAVEQDQPAERREPLQECAGAPPTPDLAESETARDEHEVDSLRPLRPDRRYGLRRTSWRSGSQGPP